jgi:hypothetical protein
MLSPNEPSSSKISDCIHNSCELGSASFFPWERPNFQYVERSSPSYDTAPIGLACLSPDCRYFQINQRLTEICGISVEDHLGRSVRDCVPALAGAVEEIVRRLCPRYACSARPILAQPSSRSSDRFDGFFVKKLRSELSTLW